MDDPLLSPLIRFAFASIFPRPNGALAMWEKKTLGHEIDHKKCFVDERHKH